MTTCAAVLEACFSGRGYYPGCLTSANVSSVSKTGSIESSPQWGQPEVQRRWCEDKAEETMQQVAHVACPLCILG